MKLNNPTPFEVTAIPLMGSGDRSMMTVIAKATYTIRPDGIDLSTEQTPIAFGDHFYARDQGGGILYESDIVPFKLRADIVLSGSAYAPEGRAADWIDASLKVGDHQKTLRVFGKRLWNYTGIFSRKYRITQTQPLLHCPITYQDAFGGVDVTTGEFCAKNPTGKGFFSLKTNEKLAGKPLPSIEDPYNQIKSVYDHPDPVGFGFYNRAWVPRSEYAGTYDDKWRKIRRSRYPEDFDFRYFNGAHPDLQVDGYLRGDEVVELKNLTRDGYAEFNLPAVRPTCHIRGSHRKGEKHIKMNLDTLFLEPDKSSFCMVWRGAIALTELADADMLMINISTLHREIRKSA
jgi:hypothetical protein